MNEADRKELIRCLWGAAVLAFLWTITFQLEKIVALLEKTLPAR